MNTDNIDEMSQSIATGLVSGNANSRNGLFRLLELYYRNRQSLPRPSHDVLAALMQAADSERISCADHGDNHDACADHISQVIISAADRLMRAAFGPHSEGEEVHHRAPELQSTVEHVEDKLRAMSAALRTTVEREVARLQGQGSSQDAAFARAVEHAIIAQTRNLIIENVQTLVCQDTPGLCTQNWRRFMGRKAQDSGLITSVEGVITLAESCQQRLFSQFDTACIDPLGRDYLGEERLDALEENLPHEFRPCSLHLDGHACVEYFSERIVSTGNKEITRLLSSGIPPASGETHAAQSRPEDHERLAILLKMASDHVQDAFPIGALSAEELARAVAWIPTYAAGTVMTAYMIHLLDNDITNSPCLRNWRKAVGDLVRDRQECESESEDEGSDDASGSDLDTESDAEAEINSELDLLADGSV